MTGISRINQVKWEPRNGVVRVTGLDHKLEFRDSKVITICTMCGEETVLSQTVTEHENKESYVYMEPDVDTEESGLPTSFTWYSDLSFYCSQECKVADNL